ncbi:hypothetical protein EV213_108148 [Aureibacillus halotolerans]|uniref:Uncharacterized protein n=1 Tax=Aureibacillus halotolerans TaxID=1508390 RepID=A0A4R6U0K7_9BACI|nr:hypothetical protein EV213_108148 [Aureibacillus halotolerans]
MLAYKTGDHVKVVSNRSLNGSHIVPIGTAGRVLRTNEEGDKVFVMVKSSEGNELVWLGDSDLEFVEGYL